MAKQKSIVGQINLNTYGTEMIVIKDNKNSDIYVKFLDEYGYITHTERRRFFEGKVSNPYDKTLYGHGYLGVGKYKKCLTINDEYIITNHYRAWEGMLKRCYNSKYHEKEPTYLQCEVCEEWLNFQNFAKWFDENYYTVDNQRMDLDKDILYKNNKIYSPETCVFVPHIINSQFSKSNAIRGEYPIGIYKHKDNGKFIARCRYGEDNIRKIKYLGVFDTPEEAFYVYKEFKENHIKYLANKYKDRIPKNLYDALLNYIVEITD